jgi:hypothetical protein
MTEERKHALLLAATILAARKLAALDSDRPSPAKLCAVETAIDQAKFILDKIDGRRSELSNGIGTNFTGNLTLQKLLN